MQSVSEPTPPRRSTDLAPIAFAATVTLILLQAYRVFVPYLVFEIDQSERAELATIALVVFGLTFLGALLVRLLGPSRTVVVAVALLAIGRLFIQFSPDSGIRWKFGAVTVVACFWLLIALLPGGGNATAIGIGFAFSLELILRGLRGTLDLPWLPGWPENLATFALLAVAVLAAVSCSSSDRFGPNEAGVRASARFVGLGSGLALWLVAAGNPGFAAVRTEIGLGGAVALLGAGTLLALWLGIESTYKRSGGSDDRAVATCVGVLGALSIAAWTWGDLRWLDLALTPVFAFAVTTLTMRCAVAPTEASVPGRWRCGAAVTLGLLLQTGFIFLFFARSGPMPLLLVPLAIVTLGALATRTPAPSPTPTRRLLQAGMAATAVAMAVAALVIAGGDEPATEAASPMTLRVMTYNIQEGFSNENIWSLEETARVIEANDPDIVILQEITRGWLVMSSVDQVRWLADQLDMDLAYAGNSYDGLWGNAILSRLPIVSTDSVIYSATDNLRRGAVAIEVDTSGGPLLVIDTHLDNPQEAIDVRLQQIEELLAFWDGASPAIIAGDFNADPGSPEWQAMVDGGFVDSGGDTTATTSEDERRIDYVWVSPDLTVTSYAVPDVWVSDHQPVVVELSI